MRLDWLILPFTGFSLSQKSNIWNISKKVWGNDKNYEVLNDDSIKVFYPKGSYSPSRSPQGGIGFYASPYEIFPAEDVTISYDVKFDETFQSVLGGKLPGLFLSEGLDKKYMRDASGGKHNNNTSSVRIAWRKDFLGEAYVYLPKNQSLEYSQIENYIENETFGDSLWRGKFQFKKNEWNTVMIRVKVNTFNENVNANNDGVLEVSINGNKQIFDKVVWRTNPSVNVTAILFSTFFGGGSIKYATPVDTWSYFKNFRALRSA